MATVPGCCGINQLDKPDQTHYPNSAVNIFFVDTENTPKNRKTIETLEKTGMTIAAEFDGVALYFKKTQKALDYEEHGEYDDDDYDDDDDDDYDYDDDF